MFAQQCLCVCARACERKLRERERVSEWKAAAALTGCIVCLSARREEEEEEEEEEETEEEWKKIEWMATATERKRRTQRVEEEK